jgi:putative zinc finger/helix-turn-helix YgiT family protein
MRIANDSPRCPACGSNDVGIIQERVTEGAGAIRVSFVDEFSKCDRCAEEFHTREQSLAASKAHAAAVRSAAGLLSPEEIREARVHLRMTQEQFEKALGVGKKTVVRWEKGTVAPSNAANGLLWLAANYPAIFRQYARSRGADELAEATLEGRIIAEIRPSQAPDQQPPETIRLTPEEEATNSISFVAFTGKHGTRADAQDNL